jgi:hypothetical protein
MPMPLCLFSRFTFNWKRTGDRFRIDDGCGPGRGLVYATVRVCGTHGVTLHDGGATKEKQKGKIDREN